MPSKTNLFSSLEQAYGQQSYGTYGQPTDVSYTQAQSTATYGQTAYAATYGQPPTGKCAHTISTLLHLEGILDVGLGIFVTNDRSFWAF